MKNTRSLRALYTTQFLSALADNMILFIIVEILKQKGSEDNLGIVQMAFLLAYVLLAAFVGPFADKNHKNQVLLIGNLIKLAGIICFILGVGEVISYFIVGIGAVIYSPAKYGLLPELSADDEQLHKANAYIEAYTIVSILAGTVIGGIAASQSLTIALGSVLVLYLLSIVAALFVPKTAVNKELAYTHAVRDFFADIKILFQIPKTAFSLIGTASFWMSSAVLRIAVIAWIPAALNITETDQQSMIFASVGLGIIIGSLLTPYMIRASAYYLAYRFGLVMVVCMLILPLTSNLWLSVLLLFVIGFSAGAYVVPMNTAVQQVGHIRVGSGKTIAVQNFCNNLLMLIGTVIYTILLKSGVDNQLLMYGLAFSMAGFVFYLISQLKKVKPAENQSIS
ncbi:LPLT family lysophospholipid transporter-like MFS transporter [Bacillus ectoiniformans]|uniref:lysophospholipid transporter LplT n=1 Tax=Bacillus ectoiniformans TaxID=1494429 RepID=UPI00195619C1|nr:lysophospholipid transporter LplT [Bacillus ectoiniformans]MBM7647873.1 LPLT family lysophospholipid transporter-like MFS transporter [Bacillus ectoiniformans]